MDRLTAFVLLTIYSALALLSAVTPHFCTETCFPGTSSSQHAQQEQGQRECSEKDFLSNTPERHHTAGSAKFLIKGKDSGNTGITKLLWRSPENQQPELNNLTHTSVPAYLLHCVFRL